MVSGITLCAQECKWTDYFGEPPYYQTASHKLARLNSVVAVWEYEIDENGNVQGTIWEWK